eukprot:CAMPEP_0119565096 /NCGR_PEP_ID=MMETSP1352-20130426/28998_1 /TAXON_ID=265584 /ORGANISM="Stauroneis constricta, Strain CCMP1120" /LENGTH=226 /DNA_ID=CAMNT_0007613945 /DNA_START=8 /DNA_END=688 /DNA_ORIENTATION=+
MTTASFSRLSASLCLVLALIAQIATGQQQVQSSQPTIDIQGRLENMDKTPFNITTKISLNDHERTAYSRSDGTFVIYNVGPGIHQLDIHSTEYHFAQVKLQILEDSMDAPKCLQYAYPGAMKQAIKYPLVLQPLATYSYFEARKGFSIFVLLKNPMVLMMLFSVGLMVLMPKLMEGLEPEEKARMKAQMEAQKDPTKMFSQMWGDLTGPMEPQQPTKGSAKRVTQK